MAAPLAKKRKIENIIIDKANAIPDPSPTMLVIKGTLHDVNTIMSSVFLNRMFIRKIGLKSLATNSPPFTIPKRSYMFDVGDISVTTPKQFFPYLDDVLAHIQREAAGRLQLYVAERKESVNITAILDGEVAVLKSDGYFGGLFGLPTGDDGKCTMSSCNGRVVHLFKQPIIGATIDM